MTGPIEGFECFQECADEFDLGHKSPWYLAQWAGEAAWWGQWENVGFYVHLRAQMDSALCSNQLTKVI